MNLVRVPFRITFAGGGTDQPSYADEHGGFCLTAAIKRYMYVALHRRPTCADYVIRYTTVEHAQTIGDISHDLVRGALTRHPLPKAEITSFADLPADCGLGSSAAVSVALVALLRFVAGQSSTPETLAEEAFAVERGYGRPIGRQDHYACAVGGIAALSFSSETTVVEHLVLSESVVTALEEHLVLVLTPATRHGGVRLLHDQCERTRAGDAAMLRNLQDTKAIAYDMRTALWKGDLQRIGDLLAYQWAVKRERSPGITTPYLDELSAHAKQHGARGGKLIGAGGGGAFLFLADDPNALRAWLTSSGLEDIPVRFDWRGALLLARDE